MESKVTTKTTQSGNRVRHWLRVLRPLGWWLIFVLILFAIRTHERLSEATRLSFSVALEGKEFLFMNGPTVAFDHRVIESGEMIPLGWHTFTVSHPQAESFTTNLFVWYGKHDFGRINLKRAKGTLQVLVNPPAEKLTIQGPEYEITLTNSPGMTSSVPTDNYVVEANYLHSRQTQQTTVFSSVPGKVAINARFGTIQLLCNQPNASFQIFNPVGELLEAGEFPSIVRDVPVGDYKLVSRHHENQQEQTLSVKAEITNSVVIEFLYGSAFLETTPAGAVVTSSDGRQLGFTPLKLEQLPTGPRQFHLERGGYESMSTVLQIEPEQTTAFSTNLVSINYANSLKTAREFLRANDFDHAYTAATAALQAKPNDPEATMVQMEAIGKSRLRRAQALGKRGDYIAAIKELELTLQALPENAEAKQLLVDYKQRMTEQTAQMRVERLGRPRKVFDSIMNGNSDYGLFEEHELKCTKPVKEVEDAIVQALKTQPAFVVTKNDSVAPETFAIEATQELSTSLNTSAGRRKCLIVGGQTRDDETQIFFKVLEYKAEAVEKFSIGALIGTPVNVSYVPIHQSRIGKITEKLQAQVNVGVSNVTERIETATGNIVTKKQ